MDTFGVIHMEAGSLPGGGSAALPHGGVAIPGSSRYLPASAFSQRHICSPASPPEACAECVAAWHAVRHAPFQRSPVAPSTVSHYRLLNKIGEGGMGVVFRAEDTTLNRTIALKFLPPHLAATEEDRSRFLQEARAAATLNHPNVCIIHGIEREGDRQFIVMEYVEGRTLRETIERAGGGVSLPLGDVLSYAIQTAEALQEAHRLGIIHRDIKSENIMVNARNQIKVMDFGLAKLKGSLRLTKGPRMIGTIGYMAPEQIQGGEIDARADIFSLGVVLYEMLTGRLPFRGENDAALIYSVLSGEPQPIEEFRPGLPPPLVALVLRALSKDPRDRYQSVSGMLLELRRIAKKSVPASRISVPAGIPPAPSASLRRFAGLLRSIVRPTTILHKGILVAVVAAAAGLVWVLAPARSVVLDQSDFLVVADFDNRTGDSVLNNSLTQALRVKLRESTQFNVMSSDRVAAARDLLRVPPSDPLDDRTAIAVARREGARAVVAGNATRLGTTYVLTAAIIDAPAGTTVDLPREEVSKIEDVLSAMDRLSGRVRHALGESISQISKANSPLPEATTSSLKALELFSRADLLTNEGRYPESALLDQEAVTIDSQFVLAINELAYDYRKIGEDSLAAEYHKRILPLIGRVTERERLEILATYYGPSFEFDFQKAKEQVLKLTTMYPNDAAPFALLGHLSMFAGDSRGALEANARAVALLPELDKNCSNNSGYALALDGRPSEAMIFFRKAKMLRPGFAAVDMNIALTHWMEEDFDSSETVLRGALTATEGLERNQIRVILSSLYYFQGRLSSARQICLDGIGECRSMRRRGDEADFQLLLGQMAGQEGNTRELRVRLNNASALSASPFPDLPLIARTYARYGMRKDAEHILERIVGQKSFDPKFTRFRQNFMDLLRGELLLAAGHPEAARGCFEEVPKIQASDPIYFLAREGIAECASAVSDSNTPALFESVLSRRGEVMLGTFSSVRRSGFWTRWLWPDAEFRLGEFYASRHQPARAIEHIGRCVRCWKNADPLDRVASRAKALLVKYSGGD
jgi:serine/threonine protein kinase/tetratricopeptide (TPR) repeat protein